MNAILFALLAFSYLDKFYAGYSALIVVAVGVFAALEFNAAPLNESRRNLARYALVVFVVFLVVVAPTLVEIFLRRASVPYEHIHDGAIQTEEAVKFFLAGINPYGADYARTPMGQWHFSGATTLALQHNGYLPMTFLLALPFYLGLQATIGWFDIRLVYLLFFLAFVFILPLLTSAWDKKLGILIAVGLNPLFVPFFIQGRNDVLILFAIGMMLLLLQRGHITAAAFALGLACATKQTAWFIVPLFFAYLLFSRAQTNWRDLFRRAVLPFFIPFALIVAPFLLWDARAFIDDTLIYPSATFPIAGYGAGQFLLMLGIIPNDTAPFPFVLLEIIFGVPLLLWLARSLRARPSLRALLAASAAFTFVVAFFNRVFQDNYVGYLVALGVIAYFLESETTHAKSSAAN
ncbi:MAG: DUF2029 domain-containing protein [Chloroflexi bacterium]|nr:DUF2029 domain-containing protein [Chloroflexota bacterium]